MKISWICISAPYNRTPDFFIAKEMPLCAFIAIEGAFGNISHISIATRSEKLISFTDLVDPNNAEKQAYCSLSEGGNNENYHRKMQ